MPCPRCNIWLDEPILWVQCWMELDTGWWVGTSLAPFLPPSLLQQVEMFWKGRSIGVTSHYAKP